MPLLPRLAVLAAVALACGPSPSDRPNVLLISVDTLRPDHLGCFGVEPSRSPSPVLDELCREALVFEQAIAQAPSTLPSHASMLTSLVPQHHGASFAAQVPLADDHVTLTEALADAGYRTAAFHNGGQVAEIWGLDQGFEVYDKVPGDRLSSVAERALGWIDSLGDSTDETETGPFFLFLHTYEVHAPYTPSSQDLEAIQEMHGLPAYDGWLGPTVGVKEIRRINGDWVGTTDAERRHVVATYDAEIRSMDRGLGALIAGLHERGLWDDTVVAFTSDHGEEMGEHGQLGRHSHTLYDELLRVPLVIKPAVGTDGVGDGARGQRVRPMVRSIDIAPTLLEAAGVEGPAAFAGQSLLGLAGGADRYAPYAVAQIDTDAEHVPEAIRSNRWKLVVQRLYDLRDDPGEQYDASTLHRDVAAELAAELERLTAPDLDAPGADAESIDVDPETREQLEALGYL